VAKKTQTDEQRAAEKRRLERIKVSEKIAENPRCVAHDVDELERELPLRDLASLIGGRGLLSDWLVEKGLQRFERQCGDPNDPFEKRELMHFYVNGRLRDALLGLMAREGTAGCRAVGPLYMRLGRDQIAHGRELGQRRRERLAQEAAAGNAMVQRGEDVDKRADLAAARRPAQPELRQLEGIGEDARRAGEALSPEERDVREREGSEWMEEDLPREEGVVAEFRNAFDSGTDAIVLLQTAGAPANLRKPDRPESQPTPPGKSLGLDGSPAEQSIDRIERPLAQDRPRREAWTGQVAGVEEEDLDG